MKANRIYAIFVCLLMGSITVHCTHDDEEVNPLSEPNPIERGDDQVLSTEGYAFDKAHSNVRWETAYLGTAALLTGRFNEFNIELEFDEDNPENITVNGSVTLSSVNTGEPHRDGGCLQSTLRTSESDEATFTSTGVVYNDEGGYDVIGDFTFLGVTREVTLKLEYLGTDLLELRNGPTNVAGFQGQFEILAKSVFGLESDNVADRIVIKVNAQFKQPQ